MRELCYSDLAWMHRRLGNVRALVRRIRKDPGPVRKVLDIGCAHGGVLLDLKEKLGVDVVGADLEPPKRQGPVHIVRCDAVCDPLPEADVAVTLMMAHHLSPDELRMMIHNVGRSCRRFLILDLVRHPVPMALFRTFVAPFVNPINVQDGIRSIERAFTPGELREIVSDALRGNPASFRHEVASFRVRQIVDIRYNHESRLS